MMGNAFLVLFETKTITGAPVFVVVLNQENAF